MAKTPSHKVSVALLGGGLVLLLVVSIIWAIGVGAVSIPLSESARIVISQFPGVPKERLLSDIPETHVTIIFQVRLPRVLLSGLVGAGLAAAGVVLQALFRNPLADPQVLGISSGAACGAAVAIVAGIGFTIGGVSSIWLCAFVGAILTMLLVFRVARIASANSATSILLAGIACSSMLTAAITIMMMWNREKLEQIYLWMMGSFSAANWLRVGFVALVLLPAIICFMVLGRELDMISLGEQEARSMGVSVRRTRVIAVVVTSLLVAASVSVSGIIGFVSLVIPHIVRLLSGPQSRKLIPLCFLFGAIFMIACDTLSRSLVPPTEIPVGAITQIIGAPYFLYLLSQSRKKEGEGR